MAGGEVVLVGPVSPAFRSHRLAGLGHGGEPFALRDRPLGSGEIAPVKAPVVDEDAGLKGAHQLVDGGIPDSRSSFSFTTTARSRASPGSTGRS